MKTDMTLFEDYQIRRIYDEEAEIWWFSVVDIVRILSQQPDYQTARKYWNKLKQRLTGEGSQLVTNCHQLRMTATDGKQRLTDVAIHQEWSGIGVKEHKELKHLTSQNLRDHMSEAELIFTALAELSTRQIAESKKATGFNENKSAAKTGGNIAQKARKELEEKTGGKVVTLNNFLPPGHKQSIEKK